MIAQWVQLLRTCMVHVIAALDVCRIRRTETVARTPVLAGQCAVAVQLNTLG